MEVYSNGLKMLVKRIWQRSMAGWSGVTLLAICQSVLVVAMINDITITQLPPESAYGSLYKEVSAHPENASWWLYLAGVVVLVLGGSTLFWRPFENIRQHVVTMFFLGVVPALFSIVIMVYVLKSH
ncbi:hypothetical protein [Halomonas caseinilytica]|uniref:hypothetical protein n=1 Tax=Halomonas caseinilytica TaxID=438744 RepID=UPI0010BE37BB|nr:hypothetical protein [Halomonas caseinilytica]